MDKQIDRQTDSPLNFLAIPQGLFTSFSVQEVTELVLGGNAALSDVERLQWKTDSADQGEPGQRLLCGVWLPDLPTHRHPLETFKTSQSTFF